MTAPLHTSTPTRQLLLSQLARLNRVIAESDQPWRVAQAHSYAARVSVYLEQPDGALDAVRGKFGANGWAPAIQEIARHMEPELLTEVASDPMRRAA